MRNDLGICLTLEHISSTLQLSLYFFVVFNNAVMHNRYSAFSYLARVGRRTMTKVRVSIMNCWNPVSCPARVCYSGFTFNMLGTDLLQELGYALCAARSFQAPRVNGNSA